METPCINICVIDTQSGYCEGCGRSVKEISRWRTMSARERRAIMKLLPQRPRPGRDKLAAKGE